MAAIFQVAAEHRLDVNVSLTESVARGWTPSRPLSLSDFKLGPLPVFRGMKDRQVEAQTKARVDSALTEFESYFNSYAGLGGSCAKLSRTAEQLGAEDFSLGIVLLSVDPCASPRLSVLLPRERKLIVVPGLRPDSEDNDCVFLAEQRQVKAIFPQALVLSRLTPGNLAAALSARKLEQPTAHVVMSGCNQTPGKWEQKGANMRSQAPPVKTEYMDSVRVDSLRVIAPRHHSRVPREVRFQGAGAPPGETIWPVVRVGEEFFIGTPVDSHSDGTFEGTIVIGRPCTDYGIVYEFRVFGGVTQPLRTGRVLGRWPVGTASSLGIELTRVDDCGTGNNEK